MRRGRDYDHIVGYDDVNQLFWYPEDITRIVLTDKVCQPFMTQINVLISLCQTRLVDVPPTQCFMCIDHIDWNRAFFKKYYEKWLFGRLLVNFNRIWVLHISLFWFYTACNAPTIYQPKQGHSSTLAWSATTLAGVVATIILAMLTEFSYIPTSWNNTFHLTRRLLFLLVTLYLMGGPTYYIAIVEFFISIAGTLLSGIMLSVRVFGFKNAGPEFKLHAYIWASLCFQTLYRTVPGITNVQQRCCGSKGQCMLHSLHIEHAKLMSSHRGFPDYQETFSNRLTAEV